MREVIVSILSGMYIKNGLMMDQILSEVHKTHFFLRGGGGWKMKFFFEQVN